MKVNEYFSTNDLSLATVLSLKFPIVRVDTSNPRKVNFIFIENSSIKKFVEEYWNGNLTVNPLSFSNQRKVLVSRINEGGRDGGW